MRITFLIGNGFDIGIGLHTQYKDFYPAYCVQKEKDNHNICAFKKMLRERETEERKKLIDWADFEKAFGEHSADPEIKDKDMYIERFEDFVTNFNAYLAGEVKMVSFENEKLISQTMKRAVTTYFHIREEDRTEISTLYDKMPGVREYCFVSFNYTNCIDECARILKKEIANEPNRRVGEVLHVHGYIENNMIMGVNDASQIKNPEFATDPDVVNEVVKPQQNIMGRTAYDRKVSSLINSSDIICIYGMSIGVTDKKWWEQITQWLEKKDTRALVILLHDDDYNERFVFKQQKVVNGTIKRFLAFSDLDENKKSELAKRIYVGGNHDVFGMKLRKNPPAKRSEHVAKAKVVPPELLAYAPVVDETNKLRSMIIDPSLMDIIG